MESSSSHITGDDGEGCNSSESGWTMYLVSPMHGDDGGGSGKGSGSEGSSVDDGYGYINGRRSRSGKAYEDYADDDSLASDASTGPAKVKAPSALPERGIYEDQGRGKNGDGGGHGGANEEDDEEDDDGGGRTRFSTESRKKAGKVDKAGEGKSSRRGNSKRGSSSRRSFFFW